MLLSDGVNSSEGQVVSQGNRNERFNRSDLAGLVVGYDGALGDENERGS